MTPRERSSPPMWAPGSCGIGPNKKKKRGSRLTPRPGEGPCARRPLVTFPILLGTLLPGQSRRPRGMPCADDAVLKGPLFRPLFWGVGKEYHTFRHQFIDTPRYFVVSRSADWQSEITRKHMIVTEMNYEKKKDALVSCMYTLAVAANKIFNYLFVRRSVFLFN